MSERHSVVHLLDCDNTLMDTDRIKRDIHAFISARWGDALLGVYVDCYEQVRADLGIVRYETTLERLVERGAPAAISTETLAYLRDYPYADRVFPGVFETLARWRGAGPLVVVTDGDEGHQRHKLARAGVTERVDGNVLVFAHKEHHLDDIERAYPAERYLFADDKPQLIAAVKGHFGPRVTTVWVARGAYAAAQTAPLAEADHTVAAIADAPSVIGV